MRKRLSITRLLYENKLVKLLFEQEEEEELFGEPAEGGAEEEPAAGEEGEEPAAGEEGEEGEEAAEEEGAPADDEPTPEEIEELSPTIDNELEALFLDFEAQSRKMADVKQVAAVVPEGARSLSQLLFEQDDAEQPEDIDTATFASQVARVIKNYENLLDMEGAIYEKAIAFLKARYDEDTIAKFEDDLATLHGISFKDVEPITTPLALGASQAQAEAS